MKERWALCVLGAWVMGSLVLFVVAPTNFHLVDELLASSPNSSFRGLVEQLGSGHTRELLRYLSSELNRDFFSRWNVAQLALAGLALWLAPRGDRALRILLLVSGALVVLLLAAFTPLITSIGRSLDFVPRDPPPSALARFQLLHVGYTGLELIKVVCLGIAAYRLVRVGAGTGTGTGAPEPVARVAG